MLQPLLFSLDLLLRRMCDALIEVVEQSRFLSLMLYDESRCCSRCLDLRVSHIVEDRFIAFMSDSRQYWQGIECDASRQFIAVEVAQIAACSPTPNDDNKVERRLFSDFFEGCYDALRNLFALHDGWKELNIEVEAVVVLFELIAKVAITSCSSATDDRNSLEQSWQRKALIVVQDTILLELLEYLSTPFCKVAKRKGRVNIDDIERVAILFVEVDLDQQFHLQAFTKCLARFFLEAQPYHVIVASPTGYPCTSHNSVALFIFLDKFAIEMSTESRCADIAQLTHHPVLLIKVILDDLMNQAVQFEKCQDFVHSLGFSVSFVSNIFHVLIKSASPKVFVGLTSSNTTQQEQSNEVGNGHECIHRVGNVPDNIKADDATKEKCHDIEDAVEAVDALMLDVVDSTLAIIAPAKNSAEGKGQDAESEQRRSYIRNLGESHFCQGCSVSITDIGISQDAADKY